MGNARKVKRPAKRRGGLGAGGRSLELDRPMGKSLAEEVQAPPPPPLASPPPAAYTPPPPSSFEPRAEMPPAYGKPPPPPMDEPAAAAPPPPMPAPRPQPAPAAAAPKPAKAIDLDLLPWVVKKQLAIETDREDLDFEVALQVEGKHDQLVIEGHRSDFGRIYARGPGTPRGVWKRYADSQFAPTPLEEAFKTFQSHVVGVTVRTDGVEIEFDGLPDFLEWAKY